MTKINLLYHRKSKCKNQDWEQLKYLKRQRERERKGMSKLTPSSPELVNIAKDNGLRREGTRIETSHYGGQNDRVRVTNGNIIKEGGEVRRVWGWSPWPLVS